MSAHSAKKAIVSIEVSPGNNVAIGQVRSFSIETSLGTIDVSTLSSTWKNFIVGQAGWTSSLELFYDPSDDAQDELVNRAITGEAINITYLALGADEIYTLDLGTNDGGSFKLNNDDTVETDDISFDATAGDIQAELRDAYEIDGIFVTGAAGVFSIAFPSGFAANLTLDSSLTGGAGEDLSLDDIPSKMTGTAHVTSWSSAGATEDAVGLSISVQGSGELVIVDD